VIRSFANKDTEKLFNRLAFKRLPEDIQRTALRKLRQLAASVTLEQMAIPPGNRLEPLKGARAGQHSVRINDQWRICFTWKDGSAYDVEIVDYHRG